MDPRPHLKSLLAKVYSRIGRVLPTIRYTPKQVSIRMPGWHLSYILLSLVRLPIEVFSPKVSLFSWGFSLAFTFYSFSNQPKER